MEGALNTCRQSMALGDFVVLTSNDDMKLPIMVLGGVEAIYTLSNLRSDAEKRLVDACLVGAWAEIA